MNLQCLKEILYFQNIENLVMVTFLSEISGKRLQAHWSSGSKFFPFSRSEEINHFQTKLIIGTCLSEIT